jgi:Rrf2 family protein
MRVNSWTEYSLIIAIHLARRQRAGQGRVSARELALLERLPADYTEQIMLRLRRAGIVESVRGAHGGYELARPPQDVSIRELMNAAEHQTFEVNCEVHPIDAERCSPGTACTIRPVWHALQRRIDRFLTGVSLADLLRDEPQVQELVTLTVDH